MRTVLGMGPTASDTHHLLEKYVDWLDRRPRSINKAMVDLGAAIASVHCMGLPSDQRPSIDDLIRFAICDARWPGAIDDIAVGGLSAAWAMQRPALGMALANPDFQYLSGIDGASPNCPLSRKAKAFLVSVGVVAADWPTETSVPDGADVISST